MPHEVFKRQFVILTSTPISEIINVYSFGEVKTWYVTIGSKEIFEVMHCMEYGDRRR